MYPYSKIENKHKRVSLARNFLPNRDERMARQHRIITINLSLVSQKNCLFLFLFLSQFSSDLKFPKDSDNIYNRLVKGNDMDCVIMLVYGCMYSMFSVHSVGLVYWPKCIV